MNPSRKKKLLPFFGLAALTMSMSLTPGAQAQDASAQPVVVKKKLTDSMTNEAQAVEATPAPVVRKKLPAPPLPAPAASETVTQTVPAAATAGTAETLKKERDAGAPAAAGGSMPVPAAAASSAPAAPPKPGAAALPAAAPAVKGPAVAQAGPAPTPAAPPRPITSKQPPAGREVRPPKAVSEPLARKTPADRVFMPYAILLASHRQMENALEELPRYRQTGLTPVVVLTEIGSKGAWWRTLFGQYKSLGEAVQAQKTLKLSDAVVVRTPYANLVGEYATEKDAAQMSIRLSQSGFFPYMLKGPGNMIMLLIGAYPTQQAAEQNRGELQGKGINAQTIER